MSVKEICDMYESGMDMDKISEKYAKEMRVSFLEAMESIRLVLKKAWR